MKKTRGIIFITIGMVLAGLLTAGCSLITRDYSKEAPEIIASCREYIDDEEHTQAFPQRDAIDYDQYDIQRFADNESESMEDDVHLDDSQILMEETDLLVTIGDSAGSANYAVLVVDKDTYVVKGYVPSKSEGLDLNSDEHER